MENILSDFASSFDTTGVTVALTSWMLEFIRGNNLGYYGVYDLESIEEVAQCTYYIQNIAENRRSRVQYAATEHEVSQYEHKVDPDLC